MPLNAKLNMWAISFLPSLRSEMDRALESCLVEEKDLEVFTTIKLKSDHQCAVVLAKAASILGFIRQHFENISVKKRLGVISQSLDF